MVPFGTDLLPREFSGESEGETVFTILVHSDYNRCMRKTGRNDPCPCGSGKKYKKCCLVKTCSPPGREDSIKSSLVQEIVLFTRKNHSDTFDVAYEYFWDDFDPVEHLETHILNMADINFWEWFVHDWIPEEEGNRTLIDIYIERSKRLRPEEKEILIRMNKAVISLYEVQEVLPEKGLLLKDLLLGGEYSVMEKAATRSLRKWDIFATRLLQLDGNTIMTGCIYPYPVHDKKAIIDHLKKSFKEYRKDFPEGTMRKFLKQNSDIFNYYWYENMRRPFSPVLMTTSGEPMVFCNALFDIRDRERVRDVLGKMEELEEEGKDVLVWLDKRKDDGPATVLGTISVKNATLKLECNSRERLDRGKMLFLSRLGDLIIHKADTIQDPYQDMKDMPASPRKTESGIPKEIEQEIYTEYMQTYYREWLNKEIPALNGETPLETVKKPWGKKKVTELLKSIENYEEHRKQQGKPWFDTSWLRERLGLGR